MKIAFLGTPVFAVASLEELAREGFDIAAVFTQPDRPKGRGQQLVASPVKEAALRLGHTVHQPERVRRPESVALLAGLGLDAMVVVGYGQIIPQSIIDLAPLGIVNVHASLLPKYRGAAPIQWAIANGETRTGVTTMRIDAGLDTGKMLLKSETEIGGEETAPELSARLALTGARLLIETMHGLEACTITPESQDHAQHSLAPILKKEDGLIDWSQPAARIHARVRGFQPWPGAYTAFRGQTLNIARCRVAEMAPPAAPGSVCLPDRKRLLVVCGAGSALEIQEVQIQGRNRVDAASFRNGQRIVENERWGETAK
jgi:methionyl-tRNA formyltransferase